MNYERILVHYRSGDTDHFDIDWHCFPDHIMMEGIASLKWKDQEYTSVFDISMPVPDSLYEIIDSYGLEYCDDVLPGSNGDQFSVRIRTDEYSKNISGSVLNIPTEQIVMKVASLSPDKFQAVAWRVFGLRDEDIPQYPLTEKHSVVCEH